VSARAGESKTPGEAGLCVAGGARAKALVKAELSPRTYGALDENPFYVLGLPVTATRVEVERAGQKLLGLLELGAAAAQSYATPLGPRVRTADKVRQATAELRDPDKRVVAELFALLPPEAPPPGPTLPPWQTARADLLGWTDTRPPPRKP
jgi:hypothetical protein